GLELRAQPAKPPVAEQRGPKLAMASSFPGVEIRPESRPGLLMAEGTDGKKEPGWLERLKSFVPRAVRLAYVDHPLGPRSSKILREYQLAELGRQVQAIADPAARVIALAQLGGEALRSGDHARGQENFREARARLEALPSGFDKGLGSSHLALELDKSGHV